MISLDTPIPKGALVAIGGREDKSFESKVLRKVSSLAGEPAHTVEIVTAASEDPQREARPYVDVFEKAGAAEVRVLEVHDHAEASDPDLADRVRAADLVFFTGGEQQRLTSLVGGTPLVRAVHDRYWAGGIVAGTNAGASALSATMIYAVEEENAMHKGNVQMMPGLALVDEAVIDTHFVSRDRFGRLLEVVASNPDLLGIGVSEDTGVIVRDGRLHVIGTGTVFVIDAHEVARTNVCEAEAGDPLAIEHLVVHTLVDHQGFDMRERSVLWSDGEDADEGTGEDGVREEDW